MKLMSFPQITGFTKSRSIEWLLPVNPLISSYNFAQNTSTVQFASQHGDGDELTARQFELMKEVHQLQREKHGLTPEGIDARSFADLVDANIDALGDTVKFIDELVADGTLPEGSSEEFIHSIENDDW